MTPEGAPSTKFLPNYRHPHIHLGGDKRPVNALKFFWRQERKIHIFPYFFFPGGGCGYCPIWPLGRPSGNDAALWSVARPHVANTPVQVHPRLGKQVDNDTQARVVCFYFLIWIVLRGWLGVLVYDFVGCCENFNIFFKGFLFTYDHFQKRNRTNGD